MKCSAQAALALGVGYMLGRRRKMRLATMLAVGAATGGAARLGPAAVKQGAKYVGTADIAGALGPQVAEIVDTVRGDLLDAAKAAAAAAVTSRIDALSDSLHERAEMLRYPEAAVGKADEAADKTAGRAGETVRGAGGSLGRVRRRGRGAEPEEEERPSSARTRSQRKKSAAKAASGAGGHQYAEGRDRGPTRPKSPRTRSGLRLTDTTKRKSPRRSPRPGVGGRPVRLSPGPGGDRHGPAGIQLPRHGDGAAQVRDPRPGRRAR
jgi:hypothetical protein